MLGGQGDLTLHEQEVAIAEPSLRWRPLAAIFLSIRRMIFPERVFGNPGANWMISGLANAPISFATNFINSTFSSADSSVPVIKVT